jgi:predicted Zn finger-like uncharacterized protein
LLGARPKSSGYALSDRSESPDFHWMIITCPSCASRYPVNAASFAPAGRKVRCAKCGHSWHQMPEEAEASMPAPVVPLPAGRKKMFGEKSKPEPVAAEAPSQPQAALEADDVAFAETGTSSEAAVAPVPATRTSVAADIGNRFRAEVRRAASMRRGRALIAAGWVLLGIFVTSTIGAGYSWRHEIAAWWPATTKVYAAVGEEINLRGLEFRNVAYERQTEEGLPVLAITGEVVNITEKRVALPRLRVGLRDENQNELYHWTFALDETVLPPNEAASFITRLSSPPPESRDIEIRFADISGMVSDASHAAPDAGDAPASE